MVQNSVALYAFCSSRFFQYLISVRVSTPSSGQSMFYPCVNACAQCTPSHTTVKASKQKSKSLFLPQ